MKYGFDKVIYNGEDHTIVAHDSGWLFIEEWLDSCNTKKRTAEISISEMMPDGITYKKHNKVCTVYYDSKGYGDNRTYHADVNWSAWGGQDLETTKRVAECLLVAVELGEAFADGFTFVTKL